MNQHSSINQKYHSPLIGAFLAAVSLFHFTPPAFAAGTDAGLPLKNRATATYEDQNNNPFDVISNEVTVTVGKVAGITNVEKGINTTGAIAPGSSVGFDFDVTNTGNDVSDIYIPDVATIAGYAGTTNNLTINSVEFSINGTTFADRSTLTDGVVPNVGVDAIIIVRVNVTVDSGASQGDTITVQLGNTGSNDINNGDTQNQPDVPASGDIDTEDVRTETATYTNGTDAGTPKVDSEPVNGQREASAINSTTVGANPLAMPRILKTNSGVDDNNTGQDLSDDIITYNLQLDVLNSAGLPAYPPGFNFTPEALEGRDFSATMTVPSIANLTNLVLISDAIPEDTELSEAVTVPGASDWVPVYTDSLLTTAAEDATWTEALPAGGLSAVTRVGWVYDARATGVGGGNGSIGTGTSTNITTDGFTFKVVANDITANSSVYNMAQVFGSTDDGDNGTTTGQITFDESGDQNPNNFNDDGTPGPDESVADGDGEFGVADPGTNEDNVDVNNNNAGVPNSPGGEVNKVELTIGGVVTSTILNGPDDDPIAATNQADALGTIFGTTPPDDNHDFQNQSTPTTSNQTVDNTTGQVTSVTSAAVITTFNNSVRNPETDQLTNVVIEPVAPNALTLGGAAGDIPDSTIVRIKYNGDTAVYTYNGTIFNLTASTIQVGGNDAPITVASINGNNSFIDYEVEVELPIGTPLSTNYQGGDPTNPNVGGYPVPIAAYVDNGTTANEPDTDDTYNVTINQAYIGFLKLVKKARVIGRVDPTDPTSAYDTNPKAGMDFDDPDEDKLPAPGDRIQYQITFENISEAQGAGTGNLTLRADDIEIVEDGELGDNNWALDNNNDNVIDTLHVNSSAVINAPGGVTTSITYQNSGASTTTTDEELTYYEASIQELDPGEDGTFRFIRKVSEESDQP